MQDADYAVVSSPVVSEDIHRAASQVGVPTIVASWVTQSLEVGQLLPTHQPALAVEREVPPVSTLQTKESSVSGDSTTAVESPIHANANAAAALPPPPRPFTTAANTNGDSSLSLPPMHDSPSEGPNAGESEIDELDAPAAADSPNRRRRGKAYSQEDIRAMQEHFRAQMELNPKPSHSAIWEIFAYSVCC